MKCKYSRFSCTLINKGRASGGAVGKLQAGSLGKWSPP